MANAIQIKRRASSGSAGKPSASSLKWGELAFNEADNILYYGYGSGNDQANTVQEIGGSGYFASRSGANASGLWPISIDGNAATVTNGITYTGTPTAGYIPKFTDSDTIENGYQISTNLGTNNSASFIPRADAVKNYVDSVKQGLDIKDSVKVATTIHLADTNYNTAGGGIGAISSNVPVALPNIDGVSLALEDRILIKNQNDPKQNGIYTVKNLGGPSPWRLERSVDADSNIKINPGMFTFVERGAVNADTGWVLTGDVIILDDIQSGIISFSQFSSAGQIYDGSGLYKQANTINVGTADSGRIVINEDNIDLAIVPQDPINLGNAGTSFIQSFTVDSYGRVTERTSASIQNATTSAKGIAQFNSNNFDVAAGTVSLQNVVSTTGNQTISGVKTFGNRPVLNSGLSAIVPATDNGSVGYFAVFDSDPSSSSQVLKSVSKSSILDDIGAATSGLILTAGSGLQGGGTLSENRTFDIITGDGIQISGDAVTVNNTVVRTSGDQIIGNSKTFNQIIISPTGTSPGNRPTLRIGHGTDYYYDFYSGVGSTASGYLLAGIHSDISNAPFKVVINNSANTSSITNGTWDATTIAVNRGGTGQTSYTNGQLLIGNTTGNTLTKATLSSGTAIDITNGTGSITIGHADTSTLLGAQGVSGIASISVDGLGHVTSVETANFVTIGNLCTAIGNCPIDGGTF
jgi:hypothetical protein